ncbi:MAG: hypothetical protein ACXAEN_14360 [Candidatus Thorarchaeota archaeon]|jgi:hypothetical protein
MEYIALTNTLNPSIPLVRRTEDWIVRLYNEAVVLVEQEYADEIPELAPWKLLTEDERLADSVGDLDSERRDWNIQYQTLIDEKALEIASGVTEALRAAMANIISMRKRKRLRWQKLDTYSKVKKVAKETLELPAGSAGRQIASFIDNHLDLVEAAGVEPEKTLTVLSKEDAFAIAASRAISRTQKMKAVGEIEEDERIERIQGIMELAATTDKASNVRRMYINGNKMRIARDTMTLHDGTTLVTFVCVDEHEFSTLDRKTESISAEYGNANPVLVETHGERIRIALMDGLIRLWAMLQAEPVTLKTAVEYVAHAGEILAALEQCGLVKETDDTYELL